MTEKWTGFQVAWTMARGYPGAFGRSANSPWIWVTLCVLFVLPFVDVRRPLCWLHADLLALVGFSVSLAFFNNARLDLSVPLTYPLLAYLLARLLWIGLRRVPAAGRAAAPERPWRWLGVAALFLLGFRIGLNAADGNVIDVGYSGVIGADKLTHGRDIWGAFPSDNEHGDTYGPLLYLAYVPFELMFPWHGQLGPACPRRTRRRASSTLLCVVLLFLIGRRLSGPPLGAALAYGWVTFPFTLYATNAGTNDALPAALVLAALLVACASAAPRRADRRRRPDEVLAAAAARRCGRSTTSGRRAGAGGGCSRSCRGRPRASRSARRSSSSAPTRRRSGTGRSPSRPTARRRSRSGATTAAAWQSVQHVVQAGAVILAVARRVRPAPRRRRRARGARAARCSSRSSSRRPTGSTCTSSGSPRWR